MAAPPNVRAPAVGLSDGSSSGPKPKISKPCESMNPQTSTRPIFVIGGNANIKVIGSQQNMSTYVAQEAVGESRNPQTSTGPICVIGDNANIEVIGSQQNIPKETFISIVKPMNPQTPAVPTMVVNGVSVNNFGAINTDMN